MRLIQNKSIRDERLKTIFFFMVGMLFVCLGFAMNSPGEILSGSKTILFSPANLLTDYIALANPGAALFNVGMMTLKSLAMIKLSKVNISGALAAGIFTVAGFSFFGKNLLNSLPIILGVYLFARANGRPVGEYMRQALFGTALGPLVSEIAFNLGLPFWPGILMGVLAGVFVGFVMSPLSQHFVNFHKGFNLYNIGFTAGIIGMFFLAVLRSMGIEVRAMHIVSSGNNSIFASALFALFGVMLVLGIVFEKGRLKSLAVLFRQSGLSGQDFLQEFGFGAALINMALLGMISTAYVLAVGAELSGPALGGIFTVVGFGAAGKHVKNVLPIIFGVFLAKMVNIFDAHSPAAVLAALFGSTLAPIAGYYGPLSGVIAGFLHMALSMNIGYLHGGMNLYNNGFSGGFIAAALVPVLEFIRERVALRKARANDTAENAMDMENL
ncbi:MAG: DUF1576 domain-containing protein [Christensenellales bacterium]|jgi:hypothetical protein